MRVCIVFLLFFAFATCQDVVNRTVLHNGLTERIGNFSIELLYHTSKVQQNGQNLIMSPFTVWTVLAVISEGASGNTRFEINYALRIKPRNKNVTRRDFANILQWLQVNTNTVELAKLNAMFVDEQRLPSQDFQDIAQTFYDTRMEKLNFSDGAIAANYFNNAISNVTHNRIKKIIDESNFKDAKLILTSSVYFRGQWTVPFNASSTIKLPFYDSNGKKTGEVNMMYNRHTYAFSNIKELQARVIELPYGKENRLSMVIMLPNPGVSLEDMFSNFKKTNLDAFFEELRISKEEYSDDEVDCFIPRFKITSDLDMTDVLKNAMGIKDLFDERKALLPYMARTPLHVSKVIHKAEIEVTEEGTTASGVTVAEFSNRIGAVRFEANKPFTFMIIEKITNSIVFGGFYREPTLY